MSDGSVCPDCLPILTAQEIKIAGLQKTLALQTAALGRAVREDPEKKLREHEEWDRAHRLFKAWQRATGHMKSKWTTKRFKQALPFLSVHDDEMILRGIEGIAFDPMTAPRKNGLGEERFDGWQTLFKDDDAFERYCNRAPVEWKDNLEDHAAEVLARR